MYAVLCGLEELFADNKAEFFKEEFGIEKIPSKPKQRHSALQIVTAYLTENGVVLGQEKVREKANEIPVFQEMFGYLKIKGKTITADVRRCQKELLAISREHLKIESMHWILNDHNLLQLISCI